MGFCFAKIPDTNDELAYTDCMKKFGTILLVLGLGVAVYLGYTQWDELLKMFELLKGASVLVLLSAVLFQFLTYVVQGIVFKYLLKIFGKDGRLWKLTRVSVAYTFITQMIPSAGVAAAPLFSAVEKTKVSKAESTVVTFVFFILYYFTFFVLLFGGFIGLFFNHQLERGQIQPVLYIVGVIFMVIVVLYVILRNRNRTLKVFSFVFDYIFAKIPFLKNAAAGLHYKAKLFVEELYDTAEILSKNKKRMFLPTLFTFLIHGFDLLTLFVLLQSFGHATSISVLIVGYCLANILTMVSGVPLGIGVFEASMALTYERLGVPFQSAFVSVFIFRALAFWFLLPIGAVIYHGLLHTWSLRGGEKNAILERSDVK